MAKPTGFMEYGRELPQYRPVNERLRDNREVYESFPEDKVHQQAARCMDCGVPTCQSGCPLGNVIPDWNDLVYRDRWREAYLRLSATNNFPEFTGRICPAPCESACVLGLTEAPVTIEQIEKEIVERAFREGWVREAGPARRTGRRVAIVGSGPAGLACADQLNRAGHAVVVFERDDRVGGLLRYGIPDFKLEKWVVDRRLDVMRRQGVRFETGIHVGPDHSFEELRAAFDAVVLCGGATAAHTLPIDGHDLDGIHLAWDFLHRHNKRVAGDDLGREALDDIRAEGRHVIVIGGGDTGSDCVGTANRQRAASVTQFELMPQPPRERTADQPWPQMPLLLKTTSSHQEGANRHWSILTQRFVGADGRVTALETVRVEPSTAGGFDAVPGTEKTWPADLVLLAIGYAGPEPDGVVAHAGVALSDRGTVATSDDFATNVEGVYAAGDMRRGQSLVVWAISEGREAARHLDAALTGRVRLPTKGPGDLLPVGAPRQG